MYGNYYLVNKHKKTNRGYKTCQRQSQDSSIAETLKQINKQLFRERKKKSENVLSFDPSLFDFLGQLELSLINYNDIF